MPHKQRVTSCLYVCGSITSTQSVVHPYFIKYSVPSQEQLLSEVRFYVCWRLLLLYFRCLSFIVDVVPSVLVCYSDLVLFYRNMTSKQRYTTVAFIVQDKILQLSNTTLCSIKAQIFRLMHSAENFSCNLYVNVLCITRGQQH